MIVWNQQCVWRKHWGMFIDRNEIHNYILFYLTPWWCITVCMKRNYTANYNYCGSDEFNFHILRYSRIYTVTTIFSVDEKTIGYETKDCPPSFLRYTEFLKVGNNWKYNFVWFHFTHNWNYQIPSMVL